MHPAAVSALCIGLAGCVTTTSTLTVQGDHATYHIASEGSCDHAKHAHYGLRVIRCETEESIDGGATALLVLAVVAALVAAMVHSLQR